MAKEEKRLAPAEVAVARAALAVARGRRRMEVILSSPDPAALVRALPADELYFTIREIGLADAAPLVPLASVGQFRTFLDLDAWRGDRLDAPRVVTWLRAARTGALRDPRAAARWRRKLNGMDRELLFFVLRDTLRVHDLKEEPDPELESDRVIRTPDGSFAVEFVPDGAAYSALRGLLDDLYAEDPFQAGRLLASLAWEVPSELEETALRWRTGRLADLGFPSPEEALSWFARPPRTAPAAADPGAPARPPGFYLAALASGSLLDRGLAALPDEERPAVEAQIVAAANAVLVADRVDVADPDAVRAAFEAARALLEFGLLARLRAAGRPLEAGDAAAALVESPVKRLFQEGFGRVLELRWRAERLLAAHDAGTREAPLLDAPLGEALLALVSRRPRFAPGLLAPVETWGTQDAAALSPRAFLTEAELLRAAGALDQAEGLLGLARTLGLSPAAGQPAHRLSTSYLTALANERLGRAFAPAPLPPAELPDAVRALARLEDPRLAGAGQAGALLSALAGAKTAELLRLADAGELRRAGDLVLTLPG